MDDDKYAEAVRRVVDQAPPLTEEQVEKLRAIFSSTAGRPKNSPDNQPLDAPETDAR